ncbi:MAG TPA: DUF2079 domain-containing protein, partial [Tepidiformaceae bacterium]
KRPWLLLGELGNWQNLRTSATVLLATAPLGLARPWTLIALVPGLMLALLSAHPEQHVLQLHYGVELVPVASLITIAGAKRIQTYMSAQRLALMVGTTALLATIWVSPFSGFGPSALAAERGPITAEHLRAVNEALKLIPDGAPVSAQAGLAPRLSHRRELGEFPASRDTLAWVIVDTSAHRTDFDFNDELDQVRAQYTMVFGNDGVEVYARRPTP